MPSPPQMGGVFDPTRSVTWGTDVAITYPTGATMVTPSTQLNVFGVTATGATGTTAALAPTVSSSIIVATGASGAGINLAASVTYSGANYEIINGMTGVLKIYAVGGTINGTTGTTAFSLTATGNLYVRAVATSSTAWFIVGNT